MWCYKKTLPWFVIVFCWSLTASAEMVDISLPYEQFGHLQNTTINGKGACAATSIINSFVYLQTAFPEVYDSKLIPGGDLDAAREALHRKIWKEDNSGGNQGDVWEQKIKWFGDHDLAGTTIFHGMTSASTDGWYQSQWIVGNQFPTWSFLWEQIEHGEDVEFGLYNHMMTLTSLKFDDLGETPNGVWDPATEQAWIDFIDPNSPGSTSWSKVTLEGGAIKLLDVTYTNPYIYYAFSESVPEPSTIIMLGMVVLCLFLPVRRRCLSG